jgi:uncharacterized cupin superfamily protein
LRASDSARKQELVEDEIGITILDPGLVDAAGVSAVPEGAHTLRNRSQVMMLAKAWVNNG